MRYKKAKKAWAKKYKKAPANKMKSYNENEENFSGYNI